MNAITTKFWSNLNKGSLPGAPIKSGLDGYDRESLQSESAGSIRDSFKEWVARDQRSDDVDRKVGHVEVDEGDSTVQISYSGDVRKGEIQAVRTFANGTVGESISRWSEGRAEELTFILNDRGRSVMLKVIDQKRPERDGYFEWNERNLQNLEQEWNLAR